MKATGKEIREIEHRLRRERPLLEAPADLTGRVLAGLPKFPGAMKRTHPVSWWTLWPKFALGGLALGLAAFLGLHRPVNGPNVDVTATPDPLLDLERVQLDVPSIDPGQVQALTVKLNEPLETELRNMISDTRHALQFVAANFLPEN